MWLFFNVLFSLLSAISTVSINQADDAPNTAAQDQADIQPSPQATLSSTNQHDKCGRPGRVGN